MARTMKSVAPKQRQDNVLVVRLDPLSVGRGHRNLPRGGTHASAKHPSRARTKRQWRKEQPDS